MIGLVRNIIFRPRRTTFSQPEGAASPKRQHATACYSREAGGTDGWGKVNQKCDGGGAAAVGNLPPRSKIIVLTNQLFSVIYASRRFVLRNGVEFFE